MNAAKIRFSHKEMELITNAEWILTKNAILQKTIQMLANVQVRQQQYLQSFSVKLPSQVIQSSPKISKGENYKGLPYQILDYPRIFNNSIMSYKHFLGKWCLSEYQNFLLNIFLFHNWWLFCWYKALFIRWPGRTN